MNSIYTIHILNHNYNPKPIIEILIQQIAICQEKIHIIFWDDASDPPYRDSLSELQSTHQSDMITWNMETMNCGRSGMRQKILESTGEGWLISIDSDMVPDSDFVDQMIHSLQDTRTVYTGYHYYENSQPADQFLLHWSYGKQREVPAQKKDPYTHFSTGIFALHTSLAKDLYFDHTIKNYGHEDTLFGLFLQKKIIPVQRTAMKALHQGLSATHDFIDKQLASVRNIQIILAKHPSYENRLIGWSNRINKIPVIRKWIQNDSVNHFCLKRLQENPKKLIYLDLLKLSEYLRVFR